MLTSCVTTDRQSGGTGDISGNHGGTRVEQAENASASAKADYNEAGIKIPVKKGDILNITVDKSNTGVSKTNIEYKANNDSLVEVTDIKGNLDTGTSHEDMVGQLTVFMDNVKIIMWVGIGFLVAGGVFAGFMRDIRTGIILGGIGAVMLVGYAIMPQIYANYMIFAVIGLIALPVMWWLHSRTTTRLYHASQKSYERLKEKYPEIAKEQSDEFKKHINIKDIKHAKKIKESR